MLSSWHHQSQMSLKPTSLNVKSFDYPKPSNVDSSISRVQYVSKNGKIQAFKPTNSFLDQTSHEAKQRSLIFNDKKFHMSHIKQW